jgi:quercetin dioxygenase-like cupin family protein
MQEPPMPNEPFHQEPVASPAAGYEVLLAGDDTGGAFALVLLTLPPYSDAPLHAHPRHDEGCYVVRGMLTATQGGRTITIGQGVSARTPAGVAHTLWNPTAAPACALLIYTPGCPAPDAGALATT